LTAGLLAGAASKPAVNNVLQVHLQEDIDKTELSTKKY
jgi:hypothetical protein